MKKTLSGLVIAASLVTSSAVFASANVTIEQASKVIAAYKELRYSCASKELSYDERRACVNKLSKASEEYREAKDFLVSARISANTSVQ